MLRPSALSAGIVVIVVAVPRAGLGFPSSRLTYTRAEGTESCPDEVAVRRAVAARLGYDPFFPAADKTIVTRIVRIRDKLHAIVELVDAKGIVKGVREFDAASDQCDELVAAAALAISIAIDPTNPAILGPAPAPTSLRAAPREAPAVPASSRVAPREAPAPEGTVKSASPRAPLADDSEEDIVDRPPDGNTSAAPFALRPGVVLVGTLGTAPSAAIGFGAFLELRKGAFSIALEGRFDLPASTALSEGGRLRTSLWVGSVVPCFHREPFFGCVLGSVGSLRAEGIGLSTSRVNDTLYVALGGRVGLDVALTERWFLRPQLDLVRALFPAELQVDGAVRWTAPPYAALGSIGLGARFP